MHVSTDKLYNAPMRGQLGSIMSVTDNNGNHSANDITAMFDLGPAVTGCGQL